LFIRPWGDRALRPTKLIDRTHQNKLRLRRKMLEKDVWQSIREKAIAYGKEMERKENSLLSLKITATKKMQTENHKHDDNDF
jgi:hypothetical protein